MTNNNRNSRINKNGIGNINISGPSRIGIIGNSIMNRNSKLGMGGNNKLGMGGNNKLGMNGLGINGNSKLGINGNGKMKSKNTFCPQNYVPYRVGDIYKCRKRPQPRANPLMFKRLEQINMNIQDMKSKYEGFKTMNQQLRTNINLLKQRLNNSQINKPIINQILNIKKQIKLLNDKQQRYIKNLKEPILEIQKQMQHTTTKPKRTKPKTTKPKTTKSKTMKSKTISKQKQEKSESRVVKQLLNSNNINKNIAMYLNKR